MFPKMRRTVNKFIFDARLRADALALLQDCIGKKIIRICFERASITWTPKFQISCFERCCLVFHTSPTSYINICLKSLFDEIRGPICDQGGLFIQKIVTERKHLRESLLLPPHTIDRSFAFNVEYPSQKEVLSIGFYGTHERQNLKDYDPYFEAEDLWKYGYKDFPDVEIDSIEFVVIEHANDQRTIITLQQGGFWFKILTNEPIESIIDTYSKGHEKNIILQQEVK